ncbi:MAG: exodeoxyribonuclease VII small subunit [Candidatus Baltobacteraceae bacterium]|jgi:exodeoxyribonuclease VII small subunit
MAEKRSGEFEQALERLEAIVKELEGGGVGLDESVRLFREGRELARKCEELLKNAQATVDAASGGGAQGAAPSDQLPF